VDDSDAAVGEAEAKRARFVEAVEAAFRVAGGKRGADRMGGGEPRGPDRRQAFAAPAAEPGFETGGKAPRQGAGRDRVPEAGRAGGPLGEIDSEADDHPILLALEQDAGELGAVEEQVVGPFDPHRRSVRSHRLVKGDGGDERERRRGRVAGLEADQGRDVEVAGGGVPRPALPALAAGLALGAQPEAFARAFARERGDVFVGGARLGDGADQNKAPAAQRVACSRGPSRIMLSGETNKPIASSSTVPTGSLVSA